MQTQYITHCAIKEQFKQTFPWCDHYLSVCLPAKCIPTCPTTRISEFRVRCQIWHIRMRASSNITCGSCKQPAAILNQPLLYSAAFLHLFFLRISVLKCYLAGVCRQYFILLHLFNYWCGSHLMFFILPVTSRPV